MNRRIKDLVDNNLIKRLGNLSIPSALFYTDVNTKKSNTLGEMLETTGTIISNSSSCKKHDCCIDSDIYKQLVDRVKPSRKDTIKHARRRSQRRKSKKRDNTSRKVS